jgi:hypothetical protein
VTFSYPRPAHGWPPFISPIEAPDSDPLTDGDFSLCIKAEWLPIVKGALAVLARPETYKGVDRAAVDLAALRGSDIFMGFQSGCAGTACPGFYPQLETWSQWTHFPAYTQLHPIDTGDGCAGNERSYFGTALYNPFSPGAGAGFRMHDIDDDTLCGGLITEVELQEVSQGTPNISVLTWLDCLGNQNQETIIGSHWQRTDFVAQWVTITSLYSFDFSIGIDGDPLCVSS